MQPGAYQLRLNSDIAKSDLQDQEHFISLCMILLLPPSPRLQVLPFLSRLVASTSFLRHPNRTAGMSWKLLASHSLQTKALAWLQLLAGRFV